MSKLSLNQERVLSLLKEHGEHARIGKWFTPREVGGSIATLNALVNGGHAERTALGGHGSEYFAYRVKK